MFRHGLYTTESPTNIQPPVTVDAAMPVAFVTAPVHLSEDPYAVTNVPRLCLTYQEAVTQFGLSMRPEIWDKYTAPQFIHSQFVLYRVAPMVLINVLDPEIHNEVVVGHPQNLIGNSMVLATEETDDNGELVKVPVEGILIDSVTASGHEAGVGFTLAFNRDGHVVITTLENGGISDNASLSLNYTKLAPEKVDIYDIIGGYDPVLDKNLGLQIVDDIFPRFRLVPGQILAPKFSGDPAVAAILDAKSTNINGHFGAISLIDIPTVLGGGRHKYTDVPAWKNENGITSTRQIPLYPMLRLGNQKYHYSAQMAGLIGRTDSENRNVPYNSPSNKNLSINGLCDENGDEIILDTPKGNFLNSQGIVAANNFSNGWTAWGNHTGAFPGNPDPKDALISMRRMFNWIQNTIILSNWHRLSSPLTPRRVESIIDSINIWFNGLAGSEYLLGGRVAIDGRNTEANLLAGIVLFKVHVMPPPPFIAGEFDFELDVSYLQTLFG